MKFFSCWQLAFEDAVYIVDAVQGGNALMQACKPAMESPYVTKVCHDCKRDSEVPYSSTSCTPFPLFCAI
jgi:ribonuclease D